ncbi:hypothetical protein BDY21DRAFT_360329 [Lineolata rhizophorae]|uniref:Uncharacterized protein n=1 Tax=Lineolata rhizophorae TaxID=578093 RepID=A0A6A6PF30_9PEZI|nr:hypothetical protein BDY21DRAFT_360329 [Lineolata rhizophorae]
MVAYSIQAFLSEGSTPLPPICFVRSARPICRTSRERRVARSASPPARSASSSARSSSPVGEHSTLSVIHGPPPPTHHPRHDSVLNAEGQYKPARSHWVDNASEGPSKPTRSSHPIRSPSPAHLRSPVSDHFAPSARRPLPPTSRQWHARHNSALDAEGQWKPARSYWVVDAGEGPSKAAHPSRFVDAGEGPSKPARLPSPAPSSPTPSSSPAHSPSPARSSLPARSLSPVRSLPSASSLPATRSASPHVRLSSAAGDHSAPSAYGLPPPTPGQWLRCHNSVLVSAEGPSKRVDEFTREKGDVRRKELRSLTAAEYRRLIGRPAPKSVRLLEAKADEEQFGQTGLAKLPAEDYLREVAPLFPLFFGEQNAPAGADHAAARVQDGEPAGAEVRPAPGCEVLTTPESTRVVDGVEYGDELRNSRGQEYVPAPPTPGRLLQKAGKTGRRLLHRTHEEEGVPRPGPSAMRKVAQRLRQKFHRVHF